MKNYASVSASKRAIEKAGLSGMVVDHNIIRYGRHAGRVEPVVICGLVEDFEEVQRRGFAAKMDTTRAAKEN